MILIIKLLGWQSKFCGYCDWLQLDFRQTYQTRGYNPYTSGGATPSPGLTNRQHEARASGPHAVRGPQREATSWFCILLLPPPPGRQILLSYETPQKFLLAPSALAIYTLRISKTCREKKTQKFSFAPSARRKMVDSLGVGGLPPFGKLSAGAHERGLQLNEASGPPDVLIRLCRLHQ